jgi:hypothetical protein
MEPGTEQVLGPEAEFQEPKVIEKPIGEDGKPIEEKPIEPEKGQQGQPFKLAYQPLWEKLENDKAKLPEGYKEGKWSEGITDEFGALRQAIIDNTEFDEAGEDDPFVAAYKSTPPDKRLDLIKTYNQQIEFLNLKPEEGITAWYRAQKDDKGEPVYTEKDVDAYVKGLSKINLDKEWGQVRGHVEQQLNEHYSGMKPKEVDMPKLIEETNTKINQMVDKSLEDFDKLDKFGEIPLTKEFKEDFADEFRLMNQINPKTGKPYLLSMLSDDKILRDMLLTYRLHKEDAYSKYLSNFKEDFKGGLLDKMNRTQRIRSGGGQQFTVAQKPEDMV